MNGPIEYLQEQLAAIRSNITAGFIDTIKIEHNGQQIPISHVAFTNPVKNNIIITPFTDGVQGSIVTAIKKYNLNIYINSKTTLVVSRPPCTGEDKKNVIKHINKLSEAAKVAVRKLRQGQRMDLKGMSKEDMKRQEKEIQKSVDEAIDKIDRIVDNKLRQI